MTAKDLSRHYVDEHIVKLIAFQVIAITLISLFTQNLYLFILLTLDFALRAFTHIPSPLALLAKLVLKLSGQDPKPIFAAPKKFAAALGFIFALTAAILLYLQLNNAAFTVGGILVFCAFLEAVFNVCIGCYVYEWLVAPFKNSQIEKHPETIGVEIPG